MKNAVNIGLTLAITRFNAAKLHCAGYSFQRFRDALIKTPENLKHILTDLCSVYGLCALQENSGIFLKCGFFDPCHFLTIDKMTVSLLEIVRSQAIPLIDSFNYSDYLINSPFGRYDGQIYANYFNHVRKQNPTGIPKYFSSTIKPVLHRGSVEDERIEFDEE